MLGSDDQELKRLINEPSTSTGRTAATVLVIRTRGESPGAAEICDLIGGSLVLASIASRDSSEVRTFARLMGEAFAAGRGVMLELACDPHPELFHILDLAGSEGSYRPLRPGGQPGGGVPIPGGCPIVVCADRETLESVSDVAFLNLFESIESV